MSGIRCAKVRERDQCNRFGYGQADHGNAIVRLATVLAFISASVAVYGQAAMLSNDEVEFGQRAPASAAGAEALEGSLKANPDDRIAHLRLIGYYWQQTAFYNRPDLRRNLIEQADWFAVHEPQSMVFDRTGFSLKPADVAAPNADDFARYKADWKNAVERNPNDRDVLLHALQALLAVDVDVPFFCERRLRVLMPTYPQYAVQLAGLYIRIIDYQWRNNAGASTAVSQLMNSDDSAVIGLTGQAIYAVGKLDTAGEAALGVSLLKRAHELDPSNARWAAALSSEPPTGVSDIAATLGNLRQEDLWVGGKVRGIVVPADALTVGPEAQAAKLVSPNPTFLKNVLSAKSPGPGEVQLLAVIGPDGRVQQTQFDSGSVRHFPYAMGMVQHWRYTPTLVDGKPVSVVTKIDLEYTVPLPPGQGIAGVAGMSGMGAVDTVAPISARPDPVLKTASPDSVKVPSDVLRALKYAETTVPYPSGAQGSGYVVLKVLISKTGTVQETTVISGDQDIQQAAMDGVKAWKYRPYLVDSEPREVQSTIAILFAGKGIAGVESPYGSPAGNGSATLASVFGGPPPIVARRPQMPGAPVRVASGTVAGMILSRPDPVYPAIAKAAHVQGEVVLHAIISKEGMIENLTAVSGPPMLVPSALEAVAKWRYKPYLLNGEPTKVDTTITVNFTFGGPDSPAAPAAAPSAPLSDP